MNFSKLEQYLDSLYDVHVPGCDLVIYKDHEQVYRHMAGYRDAKRTQPVRGDEAYCLYSATKVITTCAVMQLVEQEKINLDDPVSRYLPSYANLCVRQGEAIVPAKNTMTIRHLLSMQSGLDYNTNSPAIQKVLAETNGHATTRQLVDAFVEEPLSFEPGTNFLYSLSHDVLGAVIEVVSGKRFSEYLKENIFSPLGLETIAFNLKEEDQGRICAQYEFDDQTKSLKSLPEKVTVYRMSDQYESGGAGLISDVKDYSLFLDAIACGGKTVDGTSILSPEMIQLWSANQLGPVSRRSFDEWNRRGYSYGLGVRTRVTLTKGGPGTIGEFGWDGAAGAFAMIDPHRHISAFYAMHVKNYGYNYDVIHPNIRTLIYQGFDE